MFLSSEPGLSRHEIGVIPPSIPGQTEFVGIKREGLLFISLIYWIGAYSMSKYSQRLEKQLGVGER